MQRLSHHVPWKKYLRLHVFIYRLAFWPIFSFQTCHGYQYYWSSTILRDFLFFKCLWENPLNDFFKEIESTLVNKKMLIVIVYLHLNFYGILQDTFLKMTKWASNFSRFFYIFYESAYHKYMKISVVFILKLIGTKKLQKFAKCQKTKHFWLTI